MGFLSENLDGIYTGLDQMDAALKAQQPIDDKTFELICFALSIKARSGPCVRKHYRGALAAGSSKKELAYIFGLTMREAAGADDCWTHSVISDLADVETSSGGAGCGCD